MGKRHAHGTELLHYDVPVGPAPTAPLWDPRVLQLGIPGSWLHT